MAVLTRQRRGIVVMRFGQMKLSLANTTALWLALVLVFSVACNSDDDKKPQGDPLAPKANSAPATPASYPNVAMVTPTPPAANASREASSAPTPAEAIPPGQVAGDVAWSPDRTYVAVATSKADAPWVATLSIYQYAANRVSKVYTGAEDGRIAFARELAFHDINGDGQPDLVYSVANGGNCWACGASKALLGTVQNTFSQAVFKKAAMAAAIASKAIDANNDGIYEWLMLDASWELREFCHPCSPGSWLVYAWDGSQYADASPRYASIVDTQRKTIASQRSSKFDARTLDPIAPAANSSCRDRDEYLSDLISRYLDFMYTERAADAARLLGQMRSFNFEDLTAKRDFVVATLTGQATRPYKAGC
jgi:hypothetical protein